MKSFFALLIQKHPVLGLVPYLFRLQDHGKNFYGIGDRLMRANLESYRKQLSDAEIRIIEETEEYSDNNLKSRFTNKNITAVEFIRKLDAEYVKKFIRPFVEKHIDLTANLRIYKNLL